MAASPNWTNKTNRPGDPARLLNAHKLLDDFRNRTEDWQELDSVRKEMTESLTPDRISRVAIDVSGIVVGWIAAVPR